MSINQERLELCLSVLAEVERLPVEHPQAVAVRRATAKIYKTAKIVRRKERQAEVADADRSVIAATATAAPGRIDDETQGVRLTAPLAAQASLPRHAPSVTGATAGTLIRARNCYMCKALYNEVDSFYHQLCPTCAALSHSKRDAGTDLSGRRALLTGGRAKIGMYIALRLLRDGAHTTITTRFPGDAVRRFQAMPDSPQWMHRLRVVGIDLRDPAQVAALAESVAAQGPLDILINNAAQTVRRTSGSYAHLINGESEPLPDGPLPELITFGHYTGASPAAAAVQAMPHQRMSPSRMVELALTGGSTSLTTIDAGGLIPDLVSSNSWVQHVQQVDPIEMLEVQLCNVTAPFVLISRLRASMAASPARRKYIVNVSAMEGQFSRGYKGPGHPHTNMAKAALNMLTRTSASEMFASDRILMTSVDTGWITDERPHTTKVRLADEGFHAPLDLVDGAARVHDPIVRGEQGEDVYGCFLKDYAPFPW